MSTIILGIESSCDDTSAAVIKDGLLLSNVIASQKVHEEYGGVVPELASRAHQQNIVPVVDTAIRRAGISPSDIGNSVYTWPRPSRLPACRHIIRQRHGYRSRLQDCRCQSPARPCTEPLHTQYCNRPCARISIPLSADIRRQLPDYTRQQPQRHASTWTDY